MVQIKQEFRQSQQLVMTQQLQQSIKLLQLSALELQEFVDQELEKNPLLTREEGESASSDETPEQEAASEAQTASEENDDAGPDAPDAFAVTGGDDYRASHDATDQEEWGEHASASDGYSSDAGYSAGEHGGSHHFSGDEEGRGLEETLTSERNLREHLQEQIAVDITDSMMRLLAEMLIDRLDDAGYLREDTQQLAEVLGASELMLEATIVALQKLDPVGICARSLKECLEIQLRERNRLDPVMRIMLEHLEMIGQGDLAGLRKKCGVDEEDFAGMLADIRQCNPKPASGFTRDEAQSVIPDVIIRRGKSGQWLVELNSEALPRVLVNRRYAAEVGGKGDKEAKKFLSEQLTNANWLVKALDQRANTILKVAQEIVKQQDMFLMHGIRFLKPLVLKDISEAVGMHESTVSRVTTQKYMATPRGTLEMKYFFTSAISGSTGEGEFSSKTVMYYIKELIDAEETKNILSDDAIVTLLKRRNIDVARRTVTKYREAMHIPSSVVRRRQKSGKG
jgi:RNA polymerase sigma-54 factor